MPLYEYREHAVNPVAIDPGLRGSIVIGFQPVIDQILSLAFDLSQVKGRMVNLAFDGYYGINWTEIMAGMTVTAPIKGLWVEHISINSVYQSSKEIDAYKKRFTDIGDPGFGWVNLQGKVEDIMVPAQVKALKAHLDKNLSVIHQQPGVFIVYGPGAAINELSDSYDLRFYFDKTRQPILWDMWDGHLVPFGSDQPNPDYYWKEYYYCDYYLLDAQKTVAIASMDYWVEGISPESLKLIPRMAYDELVKTILEGPIKEVPIFQPGPWGAYRYKDLFEVKGLECNAWNETAGPELSLILDIGLEQMVNFPVTNLLQYPELFVGPYIAKQYPRCFPMDVWLDDGYFPEKTPAERTSMPIHNHPGTDYVRQHFNEIIGRYETYYIAEAYEGANTWMGYKDDADLEEWEAKCRASNNLTEIPDWKDYIAGWSTNTGDLFLIPPGTTHGHGGNQMVLEMDTSAGIAATEYSFFIYDFARPSWDDVTKTMTGKKVKMHLDHGFDNEKWVRESWVKDHLRARPIVIKWTKDYQLDRYTSDPRMPFEIERLRFSTFADYDTQGRFLHVLTLTRGTRVSMQVDANPEIKNDLVQWQSALIPAAVGNYRLVNQGEGEVEVVILHWKKG